MKKPWSKKSCPRTIRGMRVGGYNKPATSGPHDTCLVCGAPVPPVYLPGETEPSYGACYGGHDAIQQLAQLMDPQCRDCELPDEACLICGLA